MITDDGLRRTECYRVLVRPALLMGCEREPVLCTLVAAIGLAVSGFNLISLVTAATIAFGGLFCLRLMASADPMLSRVYVRHLTYRSYYPARSRPAREG